VGGLPLPHSKSNIADGAILNIAMTS